MKTADGPGRTVVHDLDKEPPPELAALFSQYADVIVNTEFID